MSDCISIIQERGSPNAYFGRNLDQFIQFIYGVRMKTAITYCALFFVAVLSFSCQIEEADLPEGKWVNSNLDQVEFGEDSIELGYGFAIPPHKFDFQVVSDSFIIKYANVFGDPHRNFELVFDFEIQDTDTLVFYSHHLDGFFGRTYRLNKFVRTDKLFIARNWDSLVVRKYIPVVYGPTESLMEKLSINSSGVVTLETGLIDTLKDGLFASTEAPLDWPLIQEQISYLDTSYFRLLAEASDAYILELRLHADSSIVKFAGYDLPLLFPELRDFVYFKYKDLTYSRVKN